MIFKYEDKYDDSIHHEEKFQFPLMKQIEDYAKKHDCSILDASRVVVPEYALKLPWRDEEFDAELKRQQDEELAAASETRLFARIKRGEV